MLSESLLEVALGRDLNTVCIGGFSHQYNNDNEHIFIAKTVAATYVMLKDLDLAAA